MGLVLKRKVGDSFIINGELVVTVTQIRGKVAVLAIDGPFRKYEILRLECEKDESLRQRRMAKLDELAENK